ncbi:MAG: hypothetical protein ACE5HN_04800 [Nitrospiria bacterium]
MKKIKKRMKTMDLIINTSPKIRMSELITEYASDYINMGDNTEERQSYLNGACTAWNIAVLPEHLRQEALCRVAEEYKRLNPGIDDSDHLVHDMEILIRKKLEMFPDVNKAILEAFLEPVNDTQYRVVVASTEETKQLRQISKGSKRRE